MAVMAALVTLARELRELRRRQILAQAAAVAQGEFREEPRNLAVPAAAVEFIYMYQ